MSQTRNTRQSGFSLLELLLVVGVGALLLLAGLATYRLVTEGNNVNAATQLLNTLKTQVQRTFQSQGGYYVGGDGQDLVPILTNSGAFPSGTLNLAGVPIDPWGQVIVIEQEGANGEAFEITISNLPQSACLKLGQAFDPIRDPDVAQVTIGTQDFVPEANPATDPVVSNISDVNAACSNDPEANDITYTFY